MNALTLSDVTKTFTMHLQGGLRLPVLRDVSFAAAPGNASFSPARPAPASRRSSS
jgi:alpha-D-ribose 1-methylphosphonate 5-triphosphate synthase subunit PhnL